MANQPGSYWHLENGGLVHLLMQEKRQRKFQRETKRKDKIMPMGKGTYGSKRGRPPMKKTKKKTKKVKK